MLILFPPAGRGTDGVKITASDSNRWDAFGVGMDYIDGMVVVGAPYHNEDGAGAVYIFEEMGGFWIQTGKLTALDSSPDSLFGRSLSIDENIIVVGSDYNDAAGKDSGAAYVFEKLAGNWIQTAKLTADDGAEGDLFGFPVSHVGQTIVVGSYFADAKGKDSGAVYIFEKVGGNWLQTAKLTADDGAEGDLFGVSVSMDDSLIAVGCLQEDEKGNDSGAAYVYEKSGGIWSQTAKLTASDGAPEDWFGWRVSYDNSTLVVGSRHDDDKGEDSGSAYVFEKTDGTWNQAAKLTASDGKAGDVFGHGVFIHNNVIVVGNKDDDGNGSAYVFKKPSGSWTQTDILTADDGAVGDWFGVEVVVGYDKVLVSAYRDDDRGTGSGSVYIYDLEPPPPPRPNEIAFHVGYLDFGNLMAGETKSRDLIVQNVGDFPLNVDPAATLLGFDKDYFKVTGISTKVEPYASDLNFNPSSAITLNSGQQYTLTIEFSPRAEDKNYIAYLQALNDSQVNPQVLLSLTGRKVSMYPAGVKTWILYE